MKIWTVTMQRWGDSESHNYMIGVFDSFEKANKEANKEFEYRGRGKYVPLIQRFQLNEAAKGVECKYEENNE